MMKTRHGEKSVEPYVDRVDILTVDTKARSVGRAGWMGARAVDETIDREIPRLARRTRGMCVHGNQCIRSD
jgi:hypothetical protein